jgi:hypothetical protein
MLVTPTVRIATSEDLAEVQRLIPRISHDGLASITGRRYLLVVDAPSGGLAAAAIIALAPPQAHLEALAMDSRVACHELEARIIGVASGLGEAFACTSLDVPGTLAA